MMAKILVWWDFRIEVSRLTDSNLIDEISIFQVDQKYRYLSMKKLGMADKVFKFKKVEKFDEIRLDRNFDLKLV